MSTRAPIFPSPPSLQPPVDAVSLGRILLDATARHQGPAIRFRTGELWTEWSYAELGRMTSEIARGLIALGVERGDRVAVLGATRPEWTVADCAALCAGATVVPVYHTNSPEECRYVLAHSGARVVICEDEAQLAKVQAVRAECPELEHVLAFADFTVLRERGRELPADVLDERVDGMAGDDVATVVYTSGTTGPPKGCMLTHANCVWTMRTCERELELRPPLTIFQFLPLAHVLARLTQMVTLDVGGTLAFWGGDPAHLIDDIAAAHPTHLPSVPRLFEKIRTKALAGVADAGAPKEQIFRAALDVGRRYRRAERAGGAPLPLRLAHALADHLVLAKVRGLFGDEMKLALTGAAPISREVLEFFDACGLLVLEGYGMTESCAAATLNTPHAWRFGTVGRALPGCDVTLGADGEVLMRGPNVFKGYYRDEEATRETFAGDWLLSGDLGEIDADGFVRITGRKKDLIITSSGKNITPANIEAALRESRWISQAVVFGDNRPYLVALVTLDPEEAPALAAELGLEADLAALAADERVRAAIAAEVEATNQRFARIEQVKRFEILDHDLAQAAGELTPTLKVKRNVVYERYGDRFAALYDG